MSRAGVSIQEGTTFHLNVTLVQVRVTVRDPKGKAVANLSKDDFLLYDQGKLQAISTFAVETRESRLEKAHAAITREADNQPAGEGASGLPHRFIALLFDDAHLSLEDANFARTQVVKFLDGVGPTERVGIFSTSGQMTHDFTNDKDALKKTLMGLMPRARFASDHGTCPPVNYYEADQILNWSNPLVLDTMKQWVTEACPPVCHTLEQCNVAAEALIVLVIDGLGAGARLRTTLPPRPRIR